MSEVNKREKRRKQRLTIYRHFREHGPISAVGLTKLYGIGSPRKRISELRDDPTVIADGYKICDKWVTAPNMDGEIVRFKLYWAEEREGDEDDDF